jgi:hypothetical protein
VYFFVKALLARWLIGLVEGIALNRNYFLGAAAFPLCAFSNPFSSSLTVPAVRCLSALGDARWNW